MISRIEYSNSGGLEKLSESVREQIAGLCEGYDIQKYVITGNTTMLHLLTATDPRSIATAPFEPSLLDLCKMNQCGNYGKSYTCPPHLGKTEDLIEKVKKYSRITVFQKAYRLEDSFDFESMTNDKNNFKALTKKAAKLCEDNLDDYLLLGAGPCDLCDVCGIADSVPCRFPDKAIASLESYAKKVSDLAELCSMKYINGVNTVTYFGAVIHG